MRKNIGIVCMIVGAVLLVCALALFLWNGAEANRAEKFGYEVMPLLKEAIAYSDNQTVPSDFTTQQDTVSAESTMMEEAEIDGYSYIGYLSIPSQNLELPVMSRWDYSLLKVAPCRYSGTIVEKNLVIIAHNYSSHFGTLDNLKAEDEVYFTDMKGKVTDYQVALTDVVPPASAEEVIAGDFDLALVTCTYSGKTRLVVYCNEK